MNGRLYDPQVGRMLSADPFVQSPTNPQNYNRYTYVLNNPLAYTDPSGFFWKKIKRIAKNVFRASFKGVRTISKILGPEITRIAGAIVAVWACGLGAPACYAGIAAGTEIGVSLEQGATIGQALKSGAFAGASAYVAGSIGGAYHAGDINLYQAAVLHGVSQGGLAVAQGGKFGAAFLSASFSSLAGSALPENIDIVSGTAAAAIVGGTASVIGGGKFANGAVTGAFVYVFNHYAHAQNVDDQFNDRVSGRIFDPEQIWNDFKTYGPDMALTYGSVFSGGIGATRGGLWLATKLGPRFSGAAARLSALFGPAGPVFGRAGQYGRGVGMRPGFLNRGPVRLGFGWNGSQQVFRMAIGKPGTSFHIHLDLQPLSQIGTGGRFAGRPYGYHPFK